MKRFFILEQFKNGVFCLLIQKNEQTQKVRNTNCFELLYTNILTSSDLNDLNKTLRSDGSVLWT